MAQNKRSVNSTDSIIQASKNGLHAKNIQPIKYESPKTSKPDPINIIITASILYIISSHNLHNKNYYAIIPFQILTYLSLLLI